MNKQQIREKLDSHKDYLKENFHLKEIGLFGSFQRDEQKVKSDIDVLVVFKKGHKDFFNYMRLKYYLEDLLGREVDLVIKEAIKPHLRNKILNEVEYVGEK